MANTGKVSHTSARLREIKDNLRSIAGSIEAEADLMDERGIPTIAFYSQKRIGIALDLLDEAVTVIRRTVADNSPKQYSRVV